jgi:HEAT repeat protein
VSAVLTVAVLLALNEGRAARVEGAALALLPGETYRRWIDDLADESLVVREAAAGRLRAAGRDAWPDLEAASAKHPDAECRARARDLLSLSRRRRALSYLVLEDHPSALQTLENGATSEKLRLIRTLGRNFETCSEILLDLLRDPDPEVAISVAEVLQENRNFDWTVRLLDLFSMEDLPRHPRVFELLSSAYARLQPADVQRAFVRSGPRARVRFLQLALHANLALSVSSDEIREMLRHGDPAARRAALAWLRDRGSAGTAVDVEPLLSSAEPAVVADALSTLRQIRHRPDSEAIRALLEHDDANVRDEAAQAASSFEERACLPGLRALLRDPSTAVRQTALAALWRLEGADALGLVFDVFLRDAGDSRDQAAAILATAKEWSLLRARALLKDPDSERRIRAHDLLARIEGPAALFSLAADADESVRRWALGQILRRLEVPRALETVEGFTRDPSESVRFEALRALVRLGRREHAAGLEHFLSSPEYTLRYDAAETLLEHGGDHSAEIARSLLGETDGPLRRLALNSMADRSDPGGVDRALADLRDADSRLRRAAASYLGKMLGPKREPALVARIAAEFDAADGESLALSFRLVVENGDGSSAAAVRRLVVTGRAPILDRAVRRLADWGGEKAAGDLSSLLGDDATLDEYVLMSLREARVRYPGSGSRELEAALRRLFASRDRRVRRLAVGAAEEHRLAIDALPGLIDDPTASVRAAAIGACARLAMPVAAAVIEARFDDEDPDVRVTAVTAFAKLCPFDIKTVDRAVASEDCGWAKKRMELGLKR